MEAKCPEVSCPFCHSKSITKAGIRKLKKETAQRLHCNSCLKYFTDRKLTHKAYPPKIVLNTISTYNLDYKPEADKTNPIHQLALYALALASKTKFDLKSFKCAWFDQKHYFGFFPLHAVYKKSR